MKFGFIHAHAGQYSVALMCSAMEVSRSGYYAWLKRPPSKRVYTREQADQKLLRDVVDVHRASGGKLGQKALWARLVALGKQCGRHRVARLMRKNGLKGKKKQPFRQHTTDSTHNLPVAPNVLKQNFIATAPNRTWTSDITYVRTLQGWLYLCVVLDLFSRRIVGWALMPTMTQELVLAALRRAIHARRPAAGLVFHSDRGSQYASHEVRQVLSMNKMQQSMSGKGNCYDNAVTESWFAGYKAEAVPTGGYQTRAEAHISRFEHIEAFYNTIRPHSTLGYRSPAAFEARARAVA